MRAYVSYTHHDTSEEVVLEDDAGLKMHHFQMGGNGDGFCYHHQSFDCLDNLTDEERKALSESDDRS